MDQPSLLFRERHVLIETYWNVKKNIAAVAYIRHRVLIETYWNVKIETGKRYIRRILY